MSHPDENARSEESLQSESDAPITEAEPESQPGAEPESWPGAETEALGEEIARLAAHIHAATYRMLVLLREFDAREGWAGGFRSCGHWLSWRTGIAPGASRERVRVARALAELPVLSAEMESGALSFSKARALTRVATPENEAELVELARHATAAHMERIVRAWRRVDRLEEAELEAEAKVEAERHDARRLSVYEDEDGSWVVRGRLDAEVGAVLEKALEWAEDQLFREAREGETDGEGEAEERASGSRASDGAADPTPTQRRADAMGLLAERALAGGESAGGDGPDEDATRPVRRADRYQVVVHAGPAVEHGGPAAEHAPTRPLGIDGLHVSAETSRRLACDAGLVVMSHDADGSVLNVGRKSRTVPAALRRALEARGRRCRFPGCEVRHTDAHHIRHWADGGETRLDNLVLLCRRHHRLVHEEGWGVRVDAGGRASFSRPDGSPLPGVPELPTLPDDPGSALERTHRARGIVPDGELTVPEWNGEVLDLGLAIEMLRGLGRDRPDPDGNRQS